MLPVKHMKIIVKGSYRCIVISDIHSHLDRFRMLLKKINYNHQDYLIILGDFTEKGTQAIETINYLKELQSKNKHVYVLLGNCEYALEALVTNPKYAYQMISYLRRIGKAGVITQVIDKLGLDIKKETPEFIQREVCDYLQPCFAYLKKLPTTLQLNDFIFVHAGIEKRLDWKNSSLSSMIEMKNFYAQGHCLDQYVIVGHLPTSNQYPNLIDNNIIIDEDKKIICLDGGTGVKSISQLNALVINGQDDDYQFSKEYIQPLPLYQSLVEICGEDGQANKIAWPDYEVKMLEKGKEFSICQQVATKKVLRIKNEFLYIRDNKVYCLDDYVDSYLKLEKGEKVRLLGIYGIYGYVRTNKQVGWVKLRYLKKVE